VRDGFAGEHCFDVEREVGDFLVARRDAEPAYQLAVVVDDAEQGVTEVVRGDDLLASTARQILLQQALGLPHPQWLHVPLVVDATGRRLAKRTDDLSLAALRHGGTDPRAIVAWAARISGLDNQARLSTADCLPDFDLGRVPRDPVVLDETTVGELRAAR
jgi:glutamyl-tRNA synthetase